MNFHELQLCRENRLAGESLTQTRDRLAQDGQLYALEQVNSPIVPHQDQATDEMDFAAAEITIPRYKIIQTNCRIEGATAGRFRNMLTDEEFVKLEDVVFLVQQNSRTLFMEDDFSGVKRCFSYNGYVPATSQVMAKTGQGPISNVCASRENGKIVYHCPYAQWRNALGEPDINGKKQPLCKGSIYFLGLERSSRMPFWCIFHGVAVPIIKDFLRYVNYKKMQGKQQGEDIQLYNFRFTLGLQRHTIPKGQYYVPKFENKTAITDENEIALLKKCYEVLHGSFGTGLSEAENN